MYLHTKYGTATINNIGDLLWVHFFQGLTPEIKFTVAENSERHSMTPTYIHKLNLRVNMSYIMRHALNTLFCLLSVCYLVGELICSLHTTGMLTVGLCYTCKAKRGRRPRVRSTPIDNTCTN